jgi:hypothetical protein
MSRSPQYYIYINSPRWKEKSGRCQALTKKHCVVFPWAKSSHCHHMTYKNFQKEMPLRDTVPLSKTAHWIVHWWIFWKTPLRPLVNLFLRILLILWTLIWVAIPTKSRCVRRKTHV